MISCSNDRYDINLLRTLLRITFIIIPNSLFQAKENAYFGFPRKLIGLQEREANQKSDPSFSRIVHKTRALLHSELNASKAIPDIDDRPHLFSELSVRYFACDWSGDINLNICFPTQR